MTRLVIPGLMFFSVCLIAMLTTQGDFSAQELARTVTVGEALEAFRAIIEVYIVIVGMLFTIQCAVVVGDWWTSRSHEETN